MVLLIFLSWHAKLTSSRNCGRARRWDTRQLHSARRFACIRFALMLRGVFILFSGAKLLNLLQPLQNRRFALKQPEHVVVPAALNHLTAFPADYYLGACVQ